MTQQSCWDPVSKQFVEIPGVKLGAAAMNAALAAYAAKSGVVEIPALNLEVPATTNADGTYSLLLYQLTDTADDSSLLLLSMEMEYQDSIGAKFTYDIWGGDPSITDGTSRKIASAGQDIFFTLQFPTFSSSATAAFDNSALRQGIWMKITNRLSSQIKFSAKLFCLKLPPAANPVTLPEYVFTPFSYSGPGNLSVVHVGPGQTFPEPRDALNYLAPDFTMIIHAGTYFKPIGLNSTFGGWTIKAAPGVTPEQIVWNGRGGWVTGYPRWINNESPGSGPANPFRLWFGKGIIYVQSPGTIEGIGFWYGGGGYGDALPGNEGDGEAAIRIDNLDYSVPDGQRVVRISRCTFNGCENGIFSPVGSNCDVYMQHCTFSNVIENGLTPDGLSHNFYCGGPKTVVTNSWVGGCNGNTAKSRSPRLTFDDCFLEAYSGRAIDHSEGGICVVTRCTIQQLRGPNTQDNLLGFANENQNNGDGHATFFGCTFSILRYNTTIFMNGATTDADFVPLYGPGSTFNWYPASPAASLEYLSNQYGVIGFDMPASAATMGTNHTTPNDPPRPAATAHTAANALILDYFLDADAPIGDVAFTVSGKSSGYASASPPTGMQMSVDGGGWASLPSGSSVTVTSIAIPFTAGLAEGAHTLRIRDGAGIQSNLLTFTCTAAPHVAYTTGWSSAHTAPSGNSVATPASLTFYPALISPTSTPTQVDFAMSPGVFGTGGSPPSPSVGNSGSPSGTYISNVSGTADGSNIVYTVNLSLSAPITDPREYVLFLIVTDADGTYTYQVQTGSGGPAYIVAHT